MHITYEYVNAKHLTKKKKMQFHLQTNANRNMTNNDGIQYQTDQHY